MTEPSRVPKPCRESQPACCPQTHVSQPLLLAALLQHPARLKGQSWTVLRERLDGRGKDYRDPCAGTWHLLPPQTPPRRSLPATVSSREDGVFEEPREELQKSLSLHRRGHDTSSMEPPASRQRCLRTSTCPQQGWHGEGRAGRAESGEKGFWPQPWCPKGHIHPSEV